MAHEDADFSGWATKADLPCTDGRTIMRDAFAEQSGTQVPLVWMHGHNDPANILGHAILEARDEGIYCYGYFNKSASGQNAKEAVKHGDVNSMSIWANKLVEKAKQVFHGKIREVSLVLAGANPGALIENVSIQHGDGLGMTELEDEAIIFTGLEFVDTLAHTAPADSSADPDNDGDVDNGTGPDTDQDSGEVDAQQVWESMSPEQQQLATALVERAAEAATAAAAHSDDDEDDTDNQDGAEGAEEDDGDDNADNAEENNDSDNPGDDPGTEVQGAPDPNSTNDNQDEGNDLDNQEGNEMKHNVFDQSDDDTKGGEKHTLSHDDMKGIFAKARTLGSVKEAVEDYALQHGIEDIDTLFPEAKSVTQTPDFLARRTAWVASVIDGCRHSPFTRIKSLMADLTLDEARAKGYVKGTMKREEFFRVSKRLTTPQTIYKKQKLDRDDILDITDFDVVIWLKAELRLMLEEELARAVLMGDGRSIGDEDKIQEDKIRPIATDDELYATTVYVNVAADNTNWDDVVDQLILQRTQYRGSGNPVFYTTDNALARMLLIKDTLGRRIYSTVADLAAALQCSAIIPVEVMNQDPTLVGIVVNLQDYTLGADQGGDLTMFDFFDIDFNQYKYLLETRVSGALTKPKSALVVRLTASSNVHHDPAVPTFDGTTVHVPNDADTVYKRTDTGATVAGGGTVALASGESVTIEATPASGFYFDNNAEEWTFTNEA